ncbi:hypothetical protein ACFWDI_28160 [Streptomyces sp. NPDC060064]|uniref:hypothetical protein n=1 Tax=Streptomyces sp. NPDC060064 TaxID=3347049 RepID=UPI00368DB9ED
MTVHQITCAGDDSCQEYSITAFYQPGTREERAAEHRRKLAADGWTDREGRDYCPEHSQPAAASAGGESR